MASRDETTPRPAWGWLYTTSGLAAAIVVAARVTWPTLARGRVLEGASIIVLYGVMFAWVRANRVALGRLTQQGPDGRHPMLQVITLSLRTSSMPRGEKPLEAPPAGPPPQPREESPSCGLISGRP